MKLFLIIVLAVVIGLSAANGCGRALSGAAGYDEYDCPSGHSERNPGGHLVCVNYEGGGA